MEFLIVFGGCVIVLGIAYIITTIIDETQCPRCRILAED